MPMTDHSVTSASTQRARSRALSDTLSWLAGPELGVAAAFLAAALAAVIGTRFATDLALIWPGTAIAASILIRLRKVRWPLALASIFIAGILANLLGADDSWPEAVGLAFVNVAEVAIAAYVFRVLIRYPFPDITIFQASYLTLVMAVVVPTCGALLAGGLLHLLDSAPLWESVQRGWMADALGVCVFAPPIILFSRKGLDKLREPAHLRENLLGIPVCLLMTYLAISYVPFPFVFIALAPMMAAFQVGAFGTAILTMLNCMAVMLLWIFDVRPMGVELGGGGAALESLPFLPLIATTIPPIAVGLATDARRRLNRTLRAGERRFREAMEHSPLGVVLLDRAGNWTFINAAMKQMLGLGSADTSQLKLESMAHPDEVADIYQRWNQLVEGHFDSYMITRRFRRSDGSWLWAHCAVSLTRDDNGAPTHFVAQVESLEERRLAEARLAQEREFLQTTLDSIGEAVITADAQGRITYMNDPAVVLTGKSLASARNRFLYEVLRLSRADTVSMAPDIIDRCRQAKSFVKRDEACSLLRPDGSTCYVNDSATPVLDANRDLSGFVIVLHDVTVSLQHTRELHHRADHDALTGLLNRAAFERSLHKAFAASGRAGGPCSLIVVDLDKFKRVNDSGGHAAGDAVLRHVAAVMRHSVRPADVVGRLGGDEFGMLLADCVPARAGELLARLREVLNPLVTNWEGRTHATGASLGLAQCSPGFADPGEWMKAADLACYEFKRDRRQSREFERTGTWAWSI